MYDLKTRRFNSNAIHKDLKPLERKTERIFSIDLITEIQVENENYLVVLFDEGTISLHTDKFNIKGEFKL